MAHSFFKPNLNTFAENPCSNMWSTSTQQSQIRNKGDVQKSPDTVPLSSFHLFLDPDPATSTGSDGISIRSGSLLLLKSLSSGNRGIHGQIRSENILRIASRGAGRQQGAGKLLTAWPLTGQSLVERYITRTDPSNQDRPINK